MFTVDNIQIKDRICDFRKATKATQQDLALFLDMKRASYRVKEAEGSFDWEETVQLADYFNVSPFFIRYGVEDEEICKIAKILKNKGGLREPNITIFDDIETYKEDTKLFISFLNLEPSEQKRIERYIEANNL